MPYKITDRIIDSNKNKLVSQVTSGTEVISKILVGKFSRKE